MNPYFLHDYVELYQYVKKLAMSIKAKLKKSDAKTNIDIHKLTVLLISKNHHFISKSDVSLNSLKKKFSLYFHHAKFEIDRASLTCLN